MSECSPKISASGQTTLARVLQFQKLTDADPVATLQNEADLYEASYEAAFQTLDVPYVTNTLPIQRVQPHPLDMPEDCMWGPLAQAARETHAPLTQAYGTIVTLWSGKGVNLNNRDAKTQATLFTAVLAPRGEGKSITMNRCLQVLGMEDDERVETTTTVSDRGLTNTYGGKVKAGEPLPPKVASVAKYDEIITLLEKCAIKGSTLAPTLCDVWSSPKISQSDKAGKYVMNVQLSLIGNLPINDPEEFSTWFGSATAKGLHDRFVFLPGPSGWVYSMRWRANVIVMHPCDVIIDDAGYEYIDAYRDQRAIEGRPIGRLLEIAQRVALITASAAQKRVVPMDCLQAAIRFAEWQEKVRKVYRVGEAETLDAVITNSIIDGFRWAEGEHKAGREILLDPKDPKSQIVDKYGWVRFRSLNMKKGWAGKWGSNKVQSVKAAMVAQGDLEPEWDANGGEKATHKFKLGGHYFGNA